VFLLLQKKVIIKEKLLKSIRLFPRLEKKNMTEINEFSTSIPTIQTLRLTTIMH